MDFDHSLKSDARLYHSFFRRIAVSEQARELRATCDVGVVFNTPRDFKTIFVRHSVIFLNFDSRYLVIVVLVIVATWPVERMAIELSENKIPQAWRLADRGHRESVACAQCRVAASLRNIDMDHHLLISAKRRELRLGLGIQ